MSLSEATKRIVRANVEAVREIPFDQTPGRKMTYPSSGGPGSDFFDVPIVVLRAVPEGHVARLPDGFCVLPKNFPVDETNDADWNKALADWKFRRSSV